MTLPASPTSTRRFATTLLLLAVGIAGVADEPYRRMLDDELEFTGTETLSQDTVRGGPIVLGIFAPDNEDHPVGRAVVRGAALAVDQANETGGIDGEEIRLVRRWAPDPWHAGSTEVIKLVFSDQAWAVIGGPDGASTHVLQQVATKAHIPMIAPVSSDPSLTHTRVPWIFRLPPDDHIQAGALIAAVETRQLGSIGLVTSTDHDGRTASKEIITVLDTAGASAAFHLEVTPIPDDPTEIARRIADFEPGGLILRLEGKGLRRLVAAMGDAGLECPIFVPWIPGVDLQRFPLDYPGEVISLTPFDPPESCGPYLKLVRSFIARHGDRPSPAAVYGYDAARLVIEAIRSGAAGRVELQQRLAASERFQGASGSVIWDTGGGNRAAAPQLIHR
jgi:ABC-type branched-subunit amino acid transport system substrate-binding protein